MNLHIRRLMLLSLLLVPFSLNAAESVDSRIAGKYAGQVYNGDDMDPVVTVFVALPNGRIRGNDVAEDEVETVNGTISNAVKIEGNTYSFEWTDKYGEGKAVLVFSSDFSSFKGFWTNNIERNQFEWTGTRQ